MMELFRDVLFATDMADATSWFGSERSSRAVAACTPIGKLAEERVRSLETA